VLIDNDAAQIGVACSSPWQSLFGPDWGYLQQLGWVWLARKGLLPSDGSLI